MSLVSIDDLISCDRPKSICLSQLEVGFLDEISFFGEVELTAGSSILRD